MGWIKHLGLNNYYLALFCIMGLNKYCYLGFFIFEFGKLGLLYKGVHKLFEGVQNFYLRVFRIFFFCQEYLYKKKIPLIFLKVRVCSCTPWL